MLNKSQNEELAHDLNRKIDASEIKSNTEKLGKLTRDVSCEKITGTSVTSKEALQLSPAKQS